MGDNINEYFVGSSFFPLCDLKDNWNKTIIICVDWHTMYKDVICMPVIT